MLGFVVGVQVCDATKVELCATARSKIIKSPSIISDT